MKKQYISPEVLCQKIRLDSLLNGASVTTASGTTNPINIGGDAETGGSDSRRYSVWDDEDEDEEEY